MAIDTKKKGKGKLEDIVIRSEEDAYAILAAVADGKTFEYDKIRFEGWPTLSLYMKGDKFEQSITPTVMKGLLELQRGLYRSFAAARFGTPDKRLTDDERKALEIQVRVGGGSSNFEINFQELAQKLIENIGDRMDPNKLLYTVVAIAVLYFGQSAYSAYLQSRTEERATEVANEAIKTLLEAQKFASAEETKRLAVIQRLGNQDAVIANIKDEAEDAQAGLVKSMSAASEASLAGIEVPPEVSEVLSQNARRKSQVVRLDGLYRLLKLDWSDPTTFKVRATNINTGVELDAIVQDETLTGKYKDALKAAEWSRKPVQLQINAKLLGESDYRDAVIMSAELAEQAEQ